MKIIGLNSLYNRNYTVNILSVLKQNWDIISVFDCIGKPKEKNTFLYLDGIDGEYTLKNGEKLYAYDGDLVFTPLESEYSLKFFNRKSKDSHTIGIKFLMFEEEGKPFVFSDKIVIFKSSDLSKYIKKIFDAGNIFPPCFGEMKAGIYDLLSTLGKKQKVKLLKKFYSIEKGIDYLEKDFGSEISVAEIAKICNISEVYFRKLFKEYSGMSPGEYRITMKIEKAKKYLEYDNLNVNEISSLLGYSDVSYFCKQFKSRTGLTPLEYRENTLNGFE